MKILITGVAGFIGMSVAKSLLMRGDLVVGIDNLNDYYDVTLKKSRLSILSGFPNFSFHKTDVTNHRAVLDIFKAEEVETVVHLAAQAGVRFSIENPQAFIDANIQGFINILECCRNTSVGHLVYASSSSVYGSNTTVPFGENQNVDHPISLYAATKKANELMAHTYSHLYQLPTTGLRFFTVYGPWGRPDMALFLFTKAIVQGQKIKVFNNGNMTRDFTYIDDIVQGVVGVVDKPATPSLDFDPLFAHPAQSNVPYRVFNVGNGSPVPLKSFIGALERSLGIKAKTQEMPMQPGDVQITSADTSAIREWINFQSTTDFQQGIDKFVEWYVNYYSTS